MISHDQLIYRGQRGGATPSAGALYYVVLAGLCIGSVALVSGLASAADAAPEEIVVTGTRLKITAATQSAQDVHVYNRERIDQSGQSDVTEFLNTLPEVSLNSVQSTYIGTTANLRGAAPGSTLILINGQRTQDVAGGVAAFGFFDLNTIPLTLVERIEVLPAGSSAIYGGDALAGVVNIVLKSDFTGYEADAGYKWANGTHEKNFSAAGGWKTGNLSVSIMGTYSDRSALPGEDRTITASPDYRRFGGPNLGSQFFGAPANVSSVSGNLPGLNASFAAVPVGSSGIGLTPSNFAATAGTQNTGSYTSYQSILPQAKRGGAFVSGKYRFDSGIELIAELLASAYKNESISTPPLSATGDRAGFQSVQPLRHSGAGLGRRARR